jgi:glycosyltransferase involved in cell wall biosynthesis
MDLDLVGRLGLLLPDWEIELIGPVAKIGRRRLPRAENISYPGRQPYEKLPAVMARFDVAVVPFALNEATRSISPTKTLEYLAAGLPVVSTPVPDVAADFGSIVHVAGTAEEFAAACRTALTEPADERDRTLEAIAHRYEWDAIAARVNDILEEALAGSPGRARRGEEATA